jgi:hypothetical protein
MNMNHETEALGGAEPLPGRSHAPQGKNVESRRGGDYNFGGKKPSPAPVHVQVDTAKTLADQNE